MKTLLTIIAACSILFVVGCAPAEPAATTDPTTTTTSDSRAETPATAEMGKCEKCGMEAAKSELVEEDGKWLCSHCKKA